MESIEITEAISKELSQFIASHSSTFACRGSIPIADIPFEEPVTPRSFDYKVQDVDENYHKASKLDRQHFAINFHPSSVGIIDTIAQCLVPTLPDSAGHWKGVHAELYRLNVYSAPSGFFKPPVDIPRSTQQFDWLVVCLPCRHEGGQLVVRHAGHEMTFDWSASAAAADAIHWAVFYGDCEHEVKNITKGHRVTITYNLFHTPGVGDLSKIAPALDIQTLPLYKRIKDGLANLEFMPDGGRLGIICNHAYAHNSKPFAVALPGVLKGSDMAVYSVFRAQGLKIKVVEVLIHDTGRVYYDSNEENEELCDIKNPDYMVDDPREFNTYVWRELGAASGFSRDLKHVNWLAEQPDQHSSLSEIGHVRVTVSAVFVLLFAHVLYVENATLVYVPYDGSDTAKSVHTVAAILSTCQVRKNEALVASVDAGEGESSAN
ncbi:hypothetical protein B0T17DRAFT_618232 [Bombardia bombarda]|uniref:Fe2OG dioxygenase domain-containing protein n=1 Tax=Bombardia bombarda TaxID=252184 RepID=A0AA39WUI2_9PEZI|nr:hypothetical protein B0T17DRAFT_618232 [Bombardia bombarda]